MLKTRKQSQLENRKTQETNGRHFESQNGRHNEGEGISRGNPRANRSMGLTGYCTSPASSPIGRDNKHGWYEEHEKLVAIAAGSLSPVLLVGDSLVNGLARYHRVWSNISNHCVHLILVWVVIEPSMCCGELRTAKSR